MSHSFQKNLEVSNAIFKNSYVDTHIKHARPSLIKRLIEIMAVPVEPTGWQYKHKILVKKASDKII